MDERNVEKLGRWRDVDRWIIRRRTESKVDTRCGGGRRGASQSWKKKSVAQVCMWMGMGTGLDQVQVQIRPGVDWTDGRETI